MAKSQVLDVEVKAKPILAPALLRIAETGEKVEQAAQGLLVAIRKADLTTLGAFDDHILAAFIANKWHTRPGRPAKDRRSVPHTVRTYVWEIRSAYRAGIDVGRMKTMYELRMAKKRLKEEAASETTGDTGQEIPEDLPVEVVQDLEGVRVTSPKQPNGALFHDLIATFIVLPDEERALFGRQLARLLHRYQAGLARREQPAPEPARKRA